MIRRLALLGIAGMFGVAACSDSGPDLTPRVEFALSTRAAVTAAPGLTAAPSASETYTDVAGDTLILDSGVRVRAGKPMEIRIVMGLRRGQYPNESDEQVFARLRDLGFAIP